MPEKKEHTTPDVDFSRVDAMTETEIQANALSDPDNPPLTDEQLDQMDKPRKSHTFTHGRYKNDFLLQH